MVARALPALTRDGSAAVMAERMSKEEAIAAHGLMAEEYDEIAGDFDSMDDDKSGFLDVCCTMTNDPTVPVLCAAR